MSTIHHAQNLGVGSARAWAERGPFARRLTVPGDFALAVDERAYTCLASAFEAVLAPSTLLGSLRRGPTAFPVLSIPARSSMIPSVHVPMSPEPRLPAAANLSRLSRIRYLMPISLFAVALAALGVLEGSSTSADAVHLQPLPSSADQFVNEVLPHEVEAQLQDHALWTYLERKRLDGVWKLFHVYQTQEGQIDRLIEVNGQPLTPAQVEAEDQRIQRLISQPSQVRQRQKREHDDGVQAQNLLRMFPAAFRFQYDGKQGPLVRLRFTPNPQFQPTDHTAQVFHHMEGTMLLDPEQKRLAAINGTLTSEVKFFYGLLGHLDKGGTFAVTQQEVSPHLWEVTNMHVHMRGKALFFKTIDAQEDETYSDFQPVPSDTTLHQAAELLKQAPTDLPPAQARVKN